MKKIFLFAIMAMMVAVSAQGKVKFGLRGGLNITNMSLSEDVISSSNRTGFYVGPTLKIGLPLGFDIDASALYDQREAKVNDESIKSKTIAVPLNIRKGFGMGDKASIFIFAGPQFGFRIGDEKVKDWTLKSSNFSINVGLGAMLLNHLELKANYNIACGTTADMEITKGVKNEAKANSWQIGLAYYF